MAFEARFKEEHCIIENDLTEPGDGVRKEWFEVFVVDTETQQQYRLVDGTTETKSELAALLSRAEGIAATMSDQKALAQQLNTQPVYSNSVEPIESAEPIQPFHSDDEIVF